jgi:lysophospholipase L1-like esterase
MPDFVQQTSDQIKDNYNIQGQVKAGAGAGILVDTANSDTANLTKKIDVVIFCGGANDVAKNKSKMALRHIRNFTNRINVLILS